MPVVQAVRRPLCALLVIAGALGVAACRKPYRVGEYVLVEWVKDAPPYPAYVIEQKGPRRYRVHFEGYEARWDEDVDVDAIQGRVDGPVVSPPPPEQVALAVGMGPRAVGSAAATAPYRVGDRVRVRWRGSIYNASVVGVVASDRFLVHYDGHETAWDEVIDIDRMVSQR